LALASVLVGFATPLALTSVLPFAGVLAFGVVEWLRAAAADVGLKGCALDLVGQNAGHDSGYCCGDENRGHFVVFPFL
jgi:hypothetical protein